MTNHHPPDASRGEARAYPFYVAMQIAAEKVPMSFEKWMQR